MSVKFYTRSLTGVCICVFSINNKAVEGSGSEGAPKYAGEGVTYRVFLGVLIEFFACACLLMHHVSSRSPLLMLSRRNVSGMMSHGIPVTSSHDIFVTSQAQP